jgi:hypothetical protein
MWKRTSVHSSCWLWLPRVRRSQPKGANEPRPGFQKRWFFSLADGFRKRALRFFLGVLGKKNHGSPLYAQPLCTDRVSIVDAEHIATASTRAQGGSQAGCCRGGGPTFSGGSGPKLLAADARRERGQERARLAVGAQGLGFGLPDCTAQPYCFFTAPNATVVGRAGKPRS